MHSMKRLTAAQEELHQNIEELTRAEKMLRESEKQLKTILNNSANVIIRVDRNYRVLIINAAGLRFVGLPEKQILGRTNAEIGMPEEAL